MKIQDPEQLRTWQAAHKFKLEVYRLLKSSPAASRDFKYVDQVRDAASSVESDIGEGFRRVHAAVICQFLTYALSSLQEATTRVKDGVDREHFTAAEARLSLVLGEDCKRYMKNWWDSLQKYLPPEKRGPFRSRKRPKKLRPKSTESTRSTKGPSESGSATHADAVDSSDSSDSSDSMDSMDS